MRCFVDETQTSRFVYTKRFGEVLHRSTNSDKEMAREVAIGIIGRAQDLNESPGEESQEAAEELRDVGQDLYKEYDAQL